MIISSDKLARLHTRRHGYAYEREISRDKENFLKEQKKKNKKQNKTKKTMPKG